MIILEEALTGNIIIINLSCAVIQCQCAFQKNTALKPFGSAAFEEH